MLNQLGNIHLEEETVLHGFYMHCQHPHSDQRKDLQSLLATLGKDASPMGLIGWALSHAVPRIHINSGHPLFPKPREGRKECVLEILYHLP